MGTGASFEASAALLALGVGSSCFRHVVNLDSLAGATFRVTGDCEMDHYASNLRPRPMDS